MNYPKPSRGMTLVDLLASLGAVTLALALGVPSFHALQTGIQRNQAQYALIGSFNLARAEAVRRGIPVTLCRSTDGVTCTKGPSSNWSAGWLVVVDSGTEPEILEKVRFDQPLFSLTAEGSLARGVTFLPNGIPDSAGAFRYHDRSIDTRLHLSPIGRLEVLEGEPESHES